MDKKIKEQKRKSFEALKKDTNLQGDFIEEDLAKFIKENSFDLTILCSDKKSFLSGLVFFSLLEILSTDVLIHN